MNFNRRRFVAASGAGAALAALGLPAAPARRDGQPLEVVKIVTGFPPGGTSDTLCRRVAENLRGGTYTKSALVENKAGAGGQIAVQSMKGAPTDGSVILQTPASMLMIYPHIYKKLAYDAFTDVTAVTLACTFDFGFCVGPGRARQRQGHSGVPRLVQGQSRQGQLRLAGGGLGAAFHRRAARPGGRHRAEARRLSRHAAGHPGPGRGPGPGGVRRRSASSSSRSMPARSRFLGVSGATRSRFAPNVPTFAEQGYKDMVFSEWFGFFAPGGTPAPVVQRANTALRAALAQKDVVDGLAVMGLEAMSSTPEELAALLKESYDRWGPIVKKIGFTADS